MQRRAVFCSSRGLEVGCAESLQLGGGLVSEDGIGLEAEAAGG
jgi:hypothetical protein